mgnify:CR=1 FL=1
MAKTRSASLICSVNDVQLDLEMSDLEPEPTTWKAAITKDIVLVSKARQVGIKAQCDILKQVSTTAGMPFKGLASKFFKTQQVNFVILLKEWKYHQLVLLHFDGMIIKKRQKDRLAVSINCKGENTVLGIPPSLQPTDDCQTEVIMSYELKDNTKAFFTPQK